MRVKVDAELCSGHVRCWTLAKKFFSLDKDGYNIYRGSSVEVPVEFEEAVRKAIVKCPEGAIIED